MDWLRAKLVLIAAFLCLDAFLAWQVGRLAVPVLYLQLGGPPRFARSAPLGPGSGVYIYGPTAPPGAVPSQAAPLVVQTVGVDRRAVMLLGPDYRCAPQSAAAPQAYVSDCRGPAGAEVRQLGGALLYTAPAAGGVLSAAAARRVADGVVRAVDPVGVAFLQALQAAPATHVLEYVETYDGLPLFDGTWTVRVGPTGISAERFWLRVLPAQTPVTPVIDLDQALAAAAAAYGASPHHPLEVQGPVRFGYYYPERQPPAVWTGTARPQVVVWRLVPVWRVQTTTSTCIYVNAFDGQPEGSTEGSAGAVPC